MWNHDLWNDFIDCRVSVYTGFHDSVRWDRETSFLSAEFRENEKHVGIKLHFSGIERQNSIVKGERYHSPLRGISDVFKKEHYQLPDRIVLKFSNTSINDTMGPNWLVPSLLVYGVFPNFRGPTKTSMKQKERLQALKIARAEMETIVAKSILLGLYNRDYHRPLIIWFFLEKSEEYSENVLEDGEDHSLS